MVIILEHNIEALPGVKHIAAVAASELAHVSYRDWTFRIGEDRDSAWVAR